MSSKVADDSGNTETEESTIALQKKRSRRVSFAEITSVHVFDRDDEYETPPDHSPRGDHSTQNEEYSEGNDGEIDVRRSFIGPMESPSPGSIIGSATSNDGDDSKESSQNEENLEGNKGDINGRRLFFHLMRLPSPGREVRLVPPHPMMASYVEAPWYLLTGAKKPISAFSSSVDKLSGSSYSDDMSLVGENPHKYDYERISPGLDDLLAEGRKDLHAVSDSDKLIISRSTIDTKSRFSPSNKHSVDSEPNDGRGNDMGAIDALALLAEPFSCSYKKLDGANGGHNFSPVRLITYDFSSEMHDDDVSIDKKNSSPNQLTKMLKSDVWILQLLVLKINYILLQRKMENISMPLMDAIDVETSENTVDVSHARVHTGVAKDGISTGHISPGFKVLEAEETLLSQFTWSGNKMPKNFFTSGDPTKGMVVTSGTGSLLAEITLDHAKDKRKTGISPRTDNKIKSIDSGYDGVSRENVRNGSLLTTVANKLDSLLRERAHSSSTMIEINHSKESTLIESMFSGEKNLHALQDEFGAVGNFQTPLTDKMAKYVQSKIFDGDLQIGADPVRLRDLTTGCVKAYSHRSASPFVLRGDNEPPHHKQAVELFTQSPSRKELHDAAHNDRAILFVMEDVLSPDSSQLKNSFESFSALKRMREGMIPRDSDFSETDRNRSPKHHRSAGSDSEFFSEPPNESNPETSALGRETRLEHWADVFSKFSAGAKQTISPTTNDLNLQAIGVLEDVLFNLRRLQIHEMLCIDIHSQALTYMKKVQLLSAGIHESQMLKLNTLPHLSVPRARDAHVDSSHCQSVDFEGIHAEEVAGDKVTALRQVLNSSERKITSLTKSVHVSCKMKGEPNHVNTILLVNDHLKKKACCRFILLDLQLWDVDNLESSHGHHNIVLNYLGFIIQRIAVNVGPVSSIVVSNNLNDVKILKNFPHMDVCTAFAFVLNANATRKYVGSGNLTQETQITSSVLGNLLDVIEEVQAARFELQNLAYTSFCSPSDLNCTLLILAVERLELHLHFIDFKSGRKVALALDMSCLKCRSAVKELFTKSWKACCSVLVYSFVALGFILLQTPGVFPKWFKLGTGKRFLEKWVEDWEKNHQQSLGLPSLPAWNSFCYGKPYNAGRQSIQLSDGARVRLWFAPSDIGPPLSFGSSFN
ncbi:hypothetical protein Acr_17g0009560 [Actinidia rufa]|uniref:Knl1 C-terminal RWD domain-containing protein n=1 Tax=Actinidia rufa TaxID=165716 RepID=A0A7J0G3L9_9ERIC|nr:hypothetical protein Acr_17g0009560 [Actinidia rufa]